MSSTMDMDSLGGDRFRTQPNTTSNASKRNAFFHATLCEMCRSVLTTICPTGNVMKNGFQGMYKIEDPYFLQLDWPTTILTSGNTYLHGLPLRIY